jgi:hypothetical protein
MTTGLLEPFFCVQKFVGVRVREVAPVHGEAAVVIGSGSTDETAMELNAPEEPTITICGVGSWAWDAGTRIRVKHKHKQVPNSFAIFIYFFSLKTILSSTDGY